MTRINCIPPAELTGPHLVAEYRELPRVFALVRAAIQRGEAPQIRATRSNIRLEPGMSDSFMPDLAIWQSGRQL
ncbi:hypothetical protein C038_02848 [Brucella sp. 63/311]|nr:hypothetical protein C038_02848 [Brucella sp. 63/311]